MSHRLSRRPSLSRPPGGEDDSLDKGADHRSLVDKILKKYGNPSTLTAMLLINDLEQLGIMKDDPRLTEFFAKVKEFGGPHEKIDREKMVDMIAQNPVVCHKAFHNRLVIGKFPEFCEELKDIYNAILPDRTGNQAEYIPQLADPALTEKFGFSVCTIDGQRFGHGDYTEDFCVQSSSKPISYLMAVSEHGLDATHRFVSREPSGSDFNKLILKKLGKKTYDDSEDRMVPHNPMINAGAIMSCSLIGRDKSRSDKTDRLDVGEQIPLSERFDKVMSTWQTLCGGKKVGFQNPVYLSEKATADRNFCLGYMMRESEAFPRHTNLRETLEFYFQTCSIEMDCERMAILAGTLANGGVCPITQDRVFKPEDVRNCLSLMLSCGMYTYSGEWAFSIGLPAKSGVSGNVFLVVPNLLGLCIYSPRLDHHGNSVRGVNFAKELTQRFNFHQFDNLPGVLNSRTETRIGVRGIPVKKGDTSERTPAVKLRELFSRFGPIRSIDVQDDIGCVEFERAADAKKAHSERSSSEFQEQMKAIFDEKADLRTIEKEFRNALVSNDEAKIDELGPRLESMRRNAKEYKPLIIAWDRKDDPRQSSANKSTKDTVALLFAAAQGDVREVQRLYASGCNLQSADYDKRTALHLSASEGHLPVLKFIVKALTDNDEGVALDPNEIKEMLSPVDRWGFTPLDDCIREKQPACAALLRKYEATTGPGDSPTDTPGHAA